MGGRATCAVLFAFTVPFWTGDPRATGQAAVPTIDQLISLERAGSPVISPDGMFVAFTMRRTLWEENEYETEIWLADLAANTVRQLTSGAKSSTSPAWAPDSRRLVFTESTAAGQHLRIHDFTTNTTAALTSGAHADISPVFAPDGRRIAFMGKLPGAPWKIYIIAAEGGDPRVMLDETRNQADPDWSSDGKAIVFGRSPNYMSEDASSKAIHVFNLETQQLSTLEESSGLFSPRWSPDGKFIAAMPLDQSKLMVFDVASRQWKQIASRSVNQPPNP